MLTAAIASRMSSGCMIRPINHRAESRVAAMTAVNASNVYEATAAYPAWSSLVISNRGGNVPAMLTWSS